VLDVEEEQEPGRERDDVLNHCPDGDIKHALQYIDLQSWNAIQAILLQVDTATCLDDKE
jgi:hypothetical protein